MNCDQVSFEGALRLRKRLGQRLAQLLEQNGWIQARLASAIAEHYERSMISHLEAGCVTLHLDALVKVAQALDVSIDYLMGLTEDPFPADDRSRSSSSGLRRMPLSGPTDPEGGSTNIESLPVIDLFAFRCEWLETRGSAAESCSAIEVPDDSMEPTLQAGAWILVDHRRTRRQGNGVFALHVGDEFCIRRSVYSDEDWLLASDNSKVRTIEWSSDAKIACQVVWTGRVL